MKIKETFDRLTPEQKKKVIVTLVIVAVILLGVLMYVSTRGGSRKTQPEPQGQGKEITIDTNILQKSLYMEQQKELEEKSKQMEELKKQLTDVRVELESMKKLPPVPQTERPEGAVQFPPPPPLPEQGTSEQKPLETEKVFGNISVVSVPVTVESKQEDKKKREIYLPPSFMEGHLLSGLDAPTTLGGGKANPIPVLIRIKDLAILPNNIKAKLKGCFVIAEGIGNLASERAELRVVSLSCLNRKGRAVIDSTLNGVIVDGDGKVGLRGKVVAKMGQMIARAALAGFFGGVGDALNAAATVQTTTPLGGTQTQIKEEDLIKAGVGKGLSSAFGKLQEFYMELARQTLPVIEVGAGRNVTVIITEGKNLEIKETCIDSGGDEICEF